MSTSERGASPRHPEALPCGCVPGYSRCAEAEGYWRDANSVYYRSGYDAWMRALQPYNEHFASLASK